MKVAIYSRVSTDKQDATNQLEQLRNYCQAMNYEIAAEYVDTVTGSTDDRAQFKALFEAAHQHQFDLVLFWALDRFSREGVLETLNHLQRLTKMGVGWRSFTEQYLDSLGPFADAVIAILAAIAKQERIRLSERTIAGLERARKAGKTIGRPTRVYNFAKIRDAYFNKYKSIRRTAAAFKISTDTVYRALRQEQQNEQ